MTTEVRALATAPREMDVVTQERMDLLRHTYGQGCNEAEFDLFVATANRLGLDPFARQITLTPRKKKVRNQWIEVMEPVCTIDGFRAVAEKTGQYEGQTEPQWCGWDGRWVSVWLDKDPPAAARVGVYRKGHREPMWGVAKFDAYAGRKKDGGLIGWWAKGGDHMLAKCAEALALRKAFPNVLGGIYSTEEMEQAGPVEARTEAPAATGPTPVEAQGEWEEAAEPEPTKTESQPKASEPAKPEQWAVEAAKQIEREAKGVPYEVTVRQFFGGTEPPAWTWTAEGCQRMGRADAMRLFRGLRLWGHALGTLKLTEKETADVMAREFGKDWAQTLSTGDAAKAAAAVLEEYAATRGE